jgi:hypothetical protein
MKSGNRSTVTRYLRESSLLAAIPQAQSGKPIGIDDQGKNPYKESADLIVCGPFP